MILTPWASTAFFYKRLYWKCFVTIMKTISLTSYLSRSVQQVTEYMSLKRPVIDYKCTNFGQIFKSHSFVFIFKTFINVSCIYFHINIFSE